MQLSSFEQGNKKIVADLIVTDVVKSENKNSLVEDLTLSSTVQLDCVCDIIGYFESETITMAICHCDTFDEDGNQLYYRLQHKPQIQWLNQLPSPYITFGVTFVNRDTMRYAFSLIMHINSEVIRYLVDRRKESDVISLDSPAGDPPIREESAVSASSCEDAIATAPEASEKKASIAEMLRMKVKDLKVEKSTIGESSAAISSVVKVTPDHAGAYTMNCVQLKEKAPRKSYILCQVHSPDAMLACTRLLRDVLEKEYGIDFFPVYFEESNLSLSRFKVEGMSVEMYYDYDVFLISLASDEYIMNSDLFDDFALYLSLRLHERCEQIEETATDTPTSAFEPDEDVPEY